ncbi:Serine/threonine-protein kinase/endoribonuclease IRE1a [Linum grandiflorum]
MAVAGAYKEVNVSAFATDPGRSTLVLPPLNVFEGGTITWSSKLLANPLMWSSIGVAIPVCFFLYKYRVAKKQSKIMQFLTGLSSGRGDERRIGRLSVSSIEIGKGSNGTVVFEGKYHGRDVPVKRLVTTHYEVALKEVRNLIASDCHSNIVRWDDMEFNDDFIYLALERCTCSLHDLLFVYSEAFGIQMTEGNSLPESTTRVCTILMQQMENVQLWKGHLLPSPLLLKLMRDIVCGLAHLHELGIIHRDLKPHNVLIVSEGTTFCAKISDMGISKRLIGLKSSLINATGGKHLFGDDDVLQNLNIMTDRKDLFLIQHVPEAFDLLSSLLDPDCDKRSGLSKAVDSIGVPMFGRNWGVMMDPELLEHINHYKPCNNYTTCSLLRVIRNTSHHYWELDTEIQRLFGSYPEGFDDYFTL